MRRCLVIRQKSKSSLRPREGAAGCCNGYLVSGLKSPAPPESEVETVWLTPVGAGAAAGNGRGSPLHRPELALNHVIRSVMAIAGAAA